jgi:hypothetical protein
MEAAIYKPEIENLLNLLEKILGGRKILADLLGVDKSQITRWHKLTYPDKKNLAKIIGINYIIVRLMQNFRYVDSALKWLNGENLHLNNRRPIDVLKDNRINDILLAIDMYETGSYA